MDKTEVEKNLFSKFRTSIPKHIPRIGQISKLRLRGMKLPFIRQKTYRFSLGQKAKFVKGLLCMHEGLSSDPQHQKKELSTRVLL